MNLKNLIDTLNNLEEYCQDNSDNNMASQDVAITPTGIVETEDLCPNTDIYVFNPVLNKVEVGKVDKVIISSIKPVYFRVIFEIPKYWIETQANTLLFDIEKNQYVRVDCLKVGDMVRTCIKGDNNSIISGMRVTKIIKLPTDDREDWMDVAVSTKGVSNNYFSNGILVSGGI